MRLTYTRKKTFNINGITIHSALAILLNKNLANLKSLNDEKVTLKKKKTYDQFWFINYR
jgi:hypothetical protein